MRRIAIIPVLEILNKNLNKESFNLALIDNNIKNAFKTRLFDEVIVVANNESVFDLVEQNGANYIKWEQNEVVPKVQVLEKILLHIVKKFIQKGIKIDYGCCILPEALIASPDILKNALKKLISEGLDNLMPVIPYKYPIQKALQIQNHKLIKCRSDYENIDTSVLPHAYHDFEQFYLFKVESLLKYKKLLTPNTGAIILSNLNEV